jgi:hypothetical protein
MGWGGREVAAGVEEEPDCALIPRWFEELYCLTIAVTETEQYRYREVQYIVCTRRCTISLGLGLP